MGEGSGIARLSFVPSPAFTAEYPKPASADPQMVNNLIRWLSTASPGRPGSVSNLCCVFLQTLVGVLHRAVPTAAVSPLGLESDRFRAQ